MKNKIKVFIRLYGFNNVLECYYDDIILKMHLIIIVIINKMYVTDNNFFKSLDTPNLRVYSIYG